METIGLENEITIALYAYVQRNFEWNCVCWFVCLPAPEWYMFPDAAPSTAHQPTCIACQHRLTQENGKTLEGLTVLP